jgi:hypothetical protein
VHVARAVNRADHVLLDFDGIMFDLQAAWGPMAGRMPSLIC